MCWKIPYSPSLSPEQEQDERERECDSLGSALFCVLVSSSDWQQDDNTYRQNRESFYRHPPGTSQVPWTRIGIHVLPFTSHQQGACYCHDYLSLISPPPVCVQNGEEISSTSPQPPPPRSKPSSQQHKPSKMGPVLTFSPSPTQTMSRVPNGERRRSITDIICKVSDFYSFRGESGNQSH